MSGKLIVVEGMDFSGKSTISRKLVELLEKMGHVVVKSREAGGNHKSEIIRSLLINTNLSSAQRVLLFQTSCSINCEEVIRPALAQGRVVVTDRYMLSSVVYQHAKLDLLLNLCKELDIIEPDYLIYTRCSYETTVARRGKREVLDLMDMEHTQNFNTYQSRYDTIAKSFGDDCLTIDTEGHLSDEQITTMLINFIRTKLGDIQHE